MSAAEQLAPAEPTLGELVQAIYDMREEKRALAKKERELNDGIKDLELQILDAMDAAGVEASKIDGVSVAISEQVVPAVDDWDAFGAWVIENNALYMLERRASSGAYREAREMEMDIPGVSPFTKRGINVRKVMKKA